jgi:lipoprotein-releasing system permease protein
VKVRSGFEWFVAWRYLRSRGRRASVVPLMVGVFMMLTAAGFFWLGAVEGARPSYKYTGAADWRRVHVIAVALAAYVGAAMTAFGALRHAHKTDVHGKPRLYRLSWAPPIAGLALFVPALYAIFAAQTPGPTQRFISLIPASEPMNAPWRLAFEVTGAFYLAAASGALALSLVRIIRFRRANPEPRSLDEARIAGAFAPLACALVLLVFGALLRAVVERPDGLEPIGLTVGLLDWGQVFSLTATASLLLGVLVTVFGVFYAMQSIFTTISMYGVFLGTWALVVALSVMNGFEVDLQQKILGSNAHVLVSKEDDTPFSEWRATAKKIAAVPDVLGVTAYKQSEVVIAANSNYNGVIVKGIDPRSVGRVTDLEKNLEHGAKLEKLWPILPDGGVGEYSQRPDTGDDGGTPAEEPPPIFDGADGSDAGAGAAQDRDEPPEDFSGTGDTAGDSGDARAEVEPEVAADAGVPDASVAGVRLSPRHHPSPFDSIIGDLDGDAGPGAGHVLPSRSPDVLDLGLGSATVIETPARERPLDPRVASLDGILVGRECAKNLHLYVGQEVQVVSPLGQDTPAGQIPRVRNFRVAGIFYSGMYEYDSRFAYVTLPALQSFLSAGDEVDGIEIKIRDHDDTRPVVRALQETLGPEYRVQDWMEINRNLFSALKLEKIAMFLVLTIIILVASFSIISNLIMVVVEKAKEIAILKAIGASDLGVMRVFMIEGSYIGALGTLFGLILGVATCVGLKSFGLPLDSDVYYIDRLPVSMDPIAISLVAFAGLAISFIATLYPSYVAAKLRPVDGLRYE